MKLRYQVDEGQWLDEGRNICYRSYVIDDNDPENSTFCNIWASSRELAEKRAKLIVDTLTTLQPDLLNL
jgi:hypothetical protein